MFNWKGRKIVMRLISPIPMELKETKQRSALVVKEEFTPSTEVSEKVKLLVKESKRFVHNEISERLLSTRYIHHIDIISRASLPNLSHYRMNSKKSKVLKEEVVSSTEISEEMKLEHVTEPKSHWQHSTFILYDFKDPFM